MDILRSKNIFNTPLLSKTLSRNLMKITKIPSFLPHFGTYKMVILRKFTEEGIYSEREK